MAAHPPNAPAKLFREEAKTDAIQCLACGGPIQLRGFGAIERVACPYCGSELKPDDSGALQLLQQAQRAKRQSALQLGMRGNIDDTQWEIIGIVWRECEADGIVYPWQEFLLFNPYHGYRWLVFSMSDGHWTIGSSLPGAPKAHSGLGHKSVTFKKKKYKHFQTVGARVTYVEGEFPWQVHVGDFAVAHEYVAPPESISIEEANTAEGADVNFTGMRHIPGAAVWKAFEAPGSPPPTSGVGTVRPNPWKQGSRWTWLSFVGLAGLWVLATFFYVAARDTKVVLSEQGLPLAPYNKEIEIGSKGEKTTIDFRFEAIPLSNAWAYADVMLVSQEREEGIGFGVQAEEWHGVSGGEAWREGDPRQTVTFGGVPGGKYLLQIVPQAGQQRSKGAPDNLRLNIRMREDVVLTRYLVVPFLIILGFPILYFMLGAFYEGRRWSNSDYAGSS